MRRGIGLGTGAGLLWGLAFVLPGLAPQWSAVSVTTGRYLAYGAVSLLIMAVLRRRVPQSRGLLRSHWRPGLVFAATGNVGYYLLLVLGMQAAGAPVATAVVGAIPVVIAVVANVRSPVYTWRQLCWPLLMVAVGLATVSGPQILHPAAGSRLVVALGVVATFAAVAVWTSYGISNATFLRSHPEVGGSTWSAIVGVFTGALAIVLLPVALVLGPFTGTSGPTAGDVWRLAGVAVVLGVAVSWCGTWLWNGASNRLSTTLAGLLIVTETISGYVYSYILASRLPPLTEVLGFALVIAGVVLVTRLRVDHAEHLRSSHVRRPPGQLVRGRSAAQR